MRFGPHDGAMYLLKNNSNGAGYGGFSTAMLFRIRYVGTIDNACYTPFNVTVGPGSVSVSGRPALRRTLAPISVAVSAGKVTMPVGYRSVRLYDLSGREVWSHARASADRNEDVRLPQGMADGLLQARFAP
jgi:hypothetical protein